MWGHRDVESTWGSQYNLYASFSTRVNADAWYGYAIEINVCVP